MAGNMQQEKKNRQQSKNKRNLLYKLFLKNPMYTRLAVEIKILDDQLAECDQWGVGMIQCAGTSNYLSTAKRP